MNSTTISRDKPEGNSPIKRSSKSGLLKHWKTIGILFAILLIGFLPSSWILDFGRSQAEPEFKVGSKAFTENIILGEMVKLLAKSENIEVEHQADIQGTQIVFQYLLTDAIDVYPEYVGTIRYEILKDRDIVTEDEVRTAMRNRFNLVMTKPIGFENTYAMGMLESRAEELGITKISQLASQTNLNYSLSQEFVEREDGWEKLSATYGINIPKPNGNDHALTYKQLESGSADVIVLYSTDSKIQTLDIRVLEDDLNFFPSYDAVFLYRKNLEKENPQLVELIQSFEGQIDNQQMIKLNARCEVDKRYEAEVAQEFLSDRMQVNVSVESTSVAREIFKNTVQHLDLVRMSLVACILVAIPLGIIAAKQRLIGQGVLGTIGVLQTIPGIALLVMLIAPTEWFGRSFAGTKGLGASVVPVVIALFIYSLLPIVRNTYTGLTMIPNNLLESADALGLTTWAKLWRIELPLALPSILSGIKTAAIINVGFACLGAMIGGGGYGQPIFSGVRLSDTNLILQGAIPAAVLALLVQGVFEVIERIVVPKGLKS